MNNTTQPNNFIKTLQIIHLFLVVSVIAFAIYVLYTVNENLYFSFENDRAFLYLGILVAFAGSLASKFLYSKMIGQITSKDDFKQKTLKYFSAHLFRMAMLEAPAFMCLFFALHSNNSFYFLIVSVLVVSMAFLHPTKSKFENDVPLSSKEKLMLEKL